MSDNPVSLEPMWLQALVIGGVADGVLIEKLDANHARVQLSQPEYAKPLLHSKQKNVELHRQRDTYNVHVLQFFNSETDVQRFAFCVQEDMRLSDAISHLVTVYVQRAAEERTNSDSHSVN